jgi:hypothetical protein
MDLKKIRICILPLLQEVAIISLFQEIKFLLPVSLVDSDDILDIIALRPSISINEPIILIIVVPKTILVPVMETVELNSILINPTYSYSTFEPKIYPPFQYSPMASIDSLDFVKKSYCASYGTAKKDYYDLASVAQFK